MKRAVRTLVNYTAQQVGEGSEVHAQVAHSQRPELAERFAATVGRRFEVSWIPPCEISPVLGTHTGPGLIGLAFASRADLAGIELA